MPESSSNISPSRLSSHLTETPRQNNPLDAAARFLITRNGALNAQNNELHLATTQTTELLKTAKRLVDYQTKLKQYGGDEIVSVFYKDPYNITWLEQLLDIDPQKMALALETKLRVQKIAQKHDLDPQYTPAITLGVYVALEKLDTLGLTHAPSRTAMEALDKLIEDDPPFGEGSLQRHLRDYLDTVSKSSPQLIGKQRNDRLSEVIALDIITKLEYNSQRASILKQSQGVEIEILDRLEYIPPDQRDTDYKYARMKRAEELGIQAWLPRGIKKNQLKRTDFHLAAILGVNEDVAERINEWFEYATSPTAASAAQSTIIHELMLGGFINEDILSNTWEKYSMHMSTTFPTAILHERSQAQYVHYARALSGAFASKQRGIYAGYVVDDYVVGREIADKTLQSEKFTQVAGQHTEAPASQSLIEMRLLDLTERGQYFISNHKPNLDFAFRCYWQQQEGIPLINAAERQAANSWQSFFTELSAIYKKYDVADAWWGVGRKKVENPQLQQDLASLVRKHSLAIQRFIDQEIANPEPMPKVSPKPSFILEKKHTIQTFSPEQSSREPMIQLSREDIEHLRVKEGEWITIKFGEKSYSVRVTSSAEKTLRETTLSVSQDVADALMIPNNLSLSLRFNPSNAELAIGPMIGIKANSEDLAAANLLEDQTRYFQRTVLAAQKIGAFAYVFNPNDVHVAEGIIHARILSGDGKTWKNVTVPLPDIIFDRNYEEYPEAIGRALEHIPCVNPPEFTNYIANKATISNILAENQRLEPYVPETRTFTGIRDIKDMLEKHKTVYLKPVWGQQSYGIVRIQRLENGQYRYNYTEPNPETRLGAWTTPKVETDLNKILRVTEKARSNFDTYIVQEGINMAREKDGDSLEIRFLVQRGSDGQLMVSGWEEGEKAWWTKVFAETFGEQYKDAIATNSANLAKALALQIQSSYGGHFGQMSIQIAVDTQGKSWYLEANPLPGVTNQFDWINPSLTDVAALDLTNFMSTASGFSESSIPLGGSTEIRLVDGRIATASIERNPFTLYQFGQQALAKGFSEQEKGLYDVSSLSVIQKNIAQRTDYITLRVDNDIIGCVSVVHPSSQNLRDETNLSSIYDTKPRWGIRSVLISPTLKNPHEISKKLFELALNRTQKFGADEVIITVPGTFDQNSVAEAHKQNEWMVPVIQKYAHTLLGVDVTSYGPAYVLTFPSTKS